MLTTSTGKALMDRARRLDEPLRRLTKMQQEGLAILVLTMVAVAATAATAFYAVVLFDTGRLDWGLPSLAADLLALASLAGVLALMPLMLCVAYEEPAERLAMRLRVLPAVRRMRLERMTPEGLLALAGELERRDLTTHRRAHAHVETLAQLSDQDLAEITQETVRRAEALGVSPSRFGVVGDYLGHDGPMSELVELVSLGFGERGQLTLYDRQLRRVLQAAAQPDPGPLVRQMILPALTVSPERRRTLGSVLVAILRADASRGFPEGLTERIAAGINLLDDEQFRSYELMLRSWHGDPEALLLASRSV
jgi:hypothetical protein